MATGEEPTNQHVVRMLDQILRELSDVKKRQDRLAADLDRIGKALK